MECLFYKFVAPKPRRRYAPAYWFKHTGPCSGADARHAYRVETATLPRAENVDVGKLSGGVLSLCPSEAPKQTLLTNEREREKGAHSSAQFLRESPKNQRLSRFQEE